MGLERRSLPKIALPRVFKHTRDKMLTASGNHSRRREHGSVADLDAISIFEVQVGFSHDILRVAGATLISEIMPSPAP